jgi:hypothetical protein
MTYSIGTGIPIKLEEPSKSAVKPSRAAIYAKPWKRYAVTPRQIRVNLVRLLRNRPVTRLRVPMHLRVSQIYRKVARLARRPW